MRQQQLDSWAPDAAPTFADAARHVGVLAGHAAAEGRQVAGRAAIEGKRAMGEWLVGLGSKMQGDTVPEKREHDAG